MAHPSSSLSSSCRPLLPRVVPWELNAGGENRLTAWNISSRADWLSTASFADGEYGFDDLASPGADSAGDFGGGGLRGAGGGFGGRVGGDEDEDEFDDEDDYGRRGELYDPASAPSGWGSRT